MPISGTKPADRSTPLGPVPTPDPIAAMLVTPARIRPLSGSVQAMQTILAEPLATTENPPVTKSIASGAPVADAVRTVELDGSVTDAAPKATPMIAATPTLAVPPAQTPPAISGSDAQPSRQIEQAATGSIPEESTKIAAATLPFPIAASDAAGVDRETSQVLAPEWAAVSSVVETPTIAAFTTEGGHPARTTEAVPDISVGSAPNEPVAPTNPCEAAAVEPTPVATTVADAVTSSRVNVVQVAAQAFHLQQRLLVNLPKIRSAIDLPGLAVLAVGTIVALSCTLCAIEGGVPQPLAIMVGYCTVLVSACFCALRAAHPRSGTKIPTSEKRRLNYAAWRLVTTLRVLDAARLWSGIEPGCPVSQESIGWAQAMLDAIKRGELPIHERKDANRSIDQKRANPGWHTEIPREALRAWAHSHGHAPPFLRY